MFIVRMSHGTLPMFSYIVTRNSRDTVTREIHFLVMTFVRTDHAHGDRGVVGCVNPHIQIHENLRAVFRLAAVEVCLLADRANNGERIVKLEAQRNHVPQHL